METEPHSRGVRVDGEVLALHCWACGTAHCVNPELCVPEELAYMVCSNSNCGMSMFLVNELTVDNEIRRQIPRSEVSVPFVAQLRFWR